VDGDNVKELVVPGMQSARTAGKKNIYGIENSKGGKHTDKTK
jgi:hypothetical protein